MGSGPPARRDLPAQHDLGAFLTAFSGDERSVAEYLVSEILSGLSSEVRDFLGATSVCDLIPWDLAAGLTGRQDAADLLDRLERETSVVAPVNARRSLYRMQPLLRTYLQADLERAQPARAVRPACSGGRVVGGSRRPRSRPSRT